MKKIKLLLIGVIVLAGFPASGFSEGETQAETKKPEAQAVNAHDIQRAFEKAMKDIEKEKADKEKIKIDAVKANFKEEAARWLTETRTKETRALNSFVKQQWQYLQEFGPYVHYDYYLRDFEFIERTSDIIKTDTLLVPYRGYIDVIEKRYVERYHTPDISYINDYLFTVTTPTRVNFEYRDGRFIFLNTDTGKETIENAWPSKIKEKFKIKS